MKFTHNEVEFETTARKYYTSSRTFAPGEDNGVFYGDDGGFDRLTDSERREMYEYMIDKWNKWLNGDFKEE